MKSRCVVAKRFIDRLIRQHCQTFDNRYSLSNFAGFRKGLNRVRIAPVEIFAPFFAAQQNNPFVVLAHPPVAIHPRNHFLVTLNPERASPRGH